MVRVAASRRHRAIALMVGYFLLQVVAVVVVVAAVLDRGRHACGVAGIRS